MAAAGFNVTLQYFSHDFQILPNGHWLIICTTLRTFTNLPGYPGDLVVSGDAVVDLDPNLKPVWYWNAFDHLDVNRHPYLFPDWTHSNSIAYSPDDGNFIISMRAPELGDQGGLPGRRRNRECPLETGIPGRFQLLNGTVPTDWFYAQHYVTFLSPNSTGIFNLGVMDNGDDRIFAPGVGCGTGNAPACLYTTIQILKINDHDMTASFQFHEILPPAFYSYFGGNTDLLENGNIEYDLAGNGPDSHIFEVTPTASPQTIWQAHLTGSNAYRGLWLPSLYPGIQW